MLLSLLVASLFVLASLSCQSNPGKIDRSEVHMRWQQLNSLPDRHGFAGMFAGVDGGVSGGVVLAAGGANFPGKPLWEGGTKVWHDSIFVLEEPGGQWKLAGKLPGPLGYGISASTRRGVVCAGGSNAQGHVKDAFVLNWRDGKIVRTELPPLPAPVANACGAAVGEVVYVSGGIASPDSDTALKSLFAIDLGAANPAWRELEPCPGLGRMLAVGASHAKSFYVFGGCDLARAADKKITRKYLTDSWRYTPGAGWKRLADLPDPSVAAPTPAPTTPDGKILILGGDDGTQARISPQAHPGFPNRILCYDPARDTWSESGKLAAPRVTVPCIEWRGKWIVISGEARPGVRSPEVWSLSIEDRP